MRDFPINCGIGVIGEFEYLNPHNYITAEQKQEYSRLLKEYASEAEHSIKTAIELNQSGEETEDGEEIAPKKVYIATTSERQTPAIQALKNLGFRSLASWHGNEGKITLWFRKADAL